MTIKRSTIIFIALCAAAPAFGKRHTPKPPPPPPAVPAMPATMAPADEPATPRPAESPPAAADAPRVDAPAAPAPKVNEPPPPPAAPDDLEGLRAEYDAIRDELFRSRARIGVVGESVFKTKLVVDVEYKAQRDWPLKRLVAQLDDRQVFAEDNPQASKSVRVYDSFAGVGKHVLAVEIQSAGPDARAGFGATGLFLIDVVDGKQTHVTVTPDESGDGPESLAKKRTGTYDVRLRAEVKTEPLPPSAGGGK